MMQLAATVTNHHIYMYARDIVGIACAQNCMFILSLIG